MSLVVDFLVLFEGCFCSDFFWMGSSVVMVSREWSRRYLVQTRWMSASVIWLMVCRKSLVKLRFLVSCQFEARSDALPDAVVRVPNWDERHMRLALFSSSFSGAELRDFISARMAFLSAGI